MIAADKHSSLLSVAPNDGEKKFYDIDARVENSSTPNPAEVISPTAELPVFRVLTQFKTADSDESSSERKLVQVHAADEGSQAAEVVEAAEVCKEEERPKKRQPPPPPPRRTPPRETKDIVECENVDVVKAAGVDAIKLSLLTTDVPD
jgi:hypothetical protein